MRAFPSSRRAVEQLAAIILIGWLVTPPLSARAQQLGPPIPLVPPPLASSPGNSPPASGRDDVVRREQLASPAAGRDSDAPPPRDALPDALWRGTPRVMADLLLARLSDTTSATLQSLVRRLLLSPAAPPEGADLNAYSLLALRISALLRLGELDAARASVAALSERERDSVLPLAIAADVIGGDIGRACATVRETVRRRPGAFWQTPLIACQALQGEIEQARLGLQLQAEEQQEPRDEVLAAIVETLAGQAPASTGRPDTLDALTLRLLVTAKWELKPAVVDGLRPDLALCLALDEDAPATIRLTAAEGAARYGALDPGRLRQLYSTLNIGGEAVATAGSDRALLFAAIAETIDPAERLTRIARFVHAFEGFRPGGFILAARLVLPELREIEPDTSLVASAPLAARLLIAAGDIGAARRWKDLVPDKKERSLDLLLALAAPPEERVPDRADVQPPLLFMALASALGEPLSPLAWAMAPAEAWTDAGPFSPPAAAWLDLGEAARAKRIGETVLAAVIVASPAEMLSTNPVALSTAVSALKEVGLTDDARRLALEAALAADL
jgi:hypothetical protein